MTLFHCMPPSNHCEWCGLKGFVDQYGELHGKEYHPVEFPELVNRNRKEPEVLLEAAGDKVRVAIERKSIVRQPKNRYMADHHNEHYLRDCFVTQIDLRDCDYSDAPYCLEIYEKDLVGREKKGIPGIAEHIARDVSSNWPKAKSRSGFTGKEPIPWRFRSLSLGEIDFDTPKSGIGMTTYLSSKPDSPEETEKERLGYIEELDGQASRAADKFVHYPDCRKLLLIQFFGDITGGIGDDEIAGIIRSACLPETIDEVWVAREEWVSLTESEVQWERIR